MKATHVSADNPEKTLEKSLPCAECGWPGMGKMPAGVRIIRQDGKDLLIGQLCYYRTNAVLCSVCQEMESAVASRSWFVEAHAEYLEQVKAKEKLLGGR